MQVARLGCGLRCVEGEKSRGWWFSGSSLAKAATAAREGGIFL